MVAVGLPGSNVSSHLFGRGDATAEALAVECAQFDFRDVQPTAVLGRVVDFEALGQTTGFGWHEGFVERGDVVGIEVVHHQSDFDRLRIAFIEHGLDEPSPILAGAALRNFNVATSGQWFDFHKQGGHAVAHIFVVKDLSVTWRGWNGWMDLADQLLVRFIHAHDRIKRIVGQLVDRQHIFHRRDERCITVGRNLPVFTQMRLQFIFFSDRCTVMVETWSAIFSSTSFSASNRTVQRWRPAGAFEQARAVSRASNSPSKFTARGLLWGLRPKAASTPSSTKRCLRCSIVRELTPKAVATSATFQGSPNFPASHRSKARA